MNNEEQALIDGLFARLKQAEADTGPRDVQAQERIKEHVAAQPAAPYYMAQAILVQEAAIKRLDETNRQLKAELEQAKARSGAPAQQGGGFLSSLFGGGQRETSPAAPAPAAAAGGWREPSRPASGQPMPPPQYQSPGYAAPPAAAAGGGFMRGALQTAAGVAGGVMLAEGISSLFHHDNAPQEIVEVIREEPSPAADHNGWGNDDQQQVASQDDWGQDRGGFSDADYSNDGDGGFFSDDDSFI